MNAIYMDVTTSSSKSAQSAIHSFVSIHITLRRPSWRLYWIGVLRLGIAALETYFRDIYLGINIGDSCQWSIGESLAVLAITLILEI